MRRVRAVVQRAAEMAVGIPCAGHAHMVRKEMRHVIAQQRTHWSYNPTERQPMVAGEGGPLGVSDGG